METILSLPPHMFLCSASRYVVFLDLHRDKYTCIPRRIFDPLIPRLNGWPSPAASDTHAAREATSRSLAKQAAALIDRGFLTPERAGTKPVRPVSTLPPRHEATGGLRVRGHVALIELVPFLLACRRADAALKTQTLEAIVRSVSARAQDDHRLPIALVADRAIRLARAFDAMRLLYPRPLLCTFDSLALLEFLAPRGIHPRWVFGVRADPFQAHCWVQLGDTLLNDRIERIARLTPIMAV